MKEIIIYSIKS